MKSGYSSKYVGVSWNKHYGNWRAACAKVFVGYFESEEDAARAYDQAARKRYGKDAKLNFPTSGEKQAIKGEESNWVDGRKSHPLYLLWRGIKQRCTNPRSTSHRWYSDTGITMYQSWLNNPQEFFNYISSELGAQPDGYSLDRIDPWGNYEPGNLRWASPAEQANNRRYNFARHMLHYIKQTYPEIYDEALRTKLCAEDEESA